jgi:hypothetical protein
MAVNVGPASSARITAPCGCWWLVVVVGLLGVGRNKLASAERERREREREYMRAGAAGGRRQEETETAWRRGAAGQTPLLLIRERWRKSRK